MRQRANVQVRSCAHAMAQMRKNANMEVLNVQVCKCAIVYMLNCANAHMRKRANVQARKCANAQIKRANAQKYKPTMYMRANS